MSRKSEIERFLNYEKNYNEQIFRNALDAARIYDTEKAPREDRDLLSESQFQTKVEELLSLLERKINIGADIIDNKTVSSKERNLFLENIPIIRTWNDLVNTYNNIPSLSSRGVLESSIQTLGQPLEILMELYEQTIDDLRMIDKYDERLNIGLGFINEILYQIRNKFYKVFDKNLLIISGRRFSLEPESELIEDISDSISTTSSSTRTRVSDIPGEGGVPAEGAVPEGQDIQAIGVIPISRVPGPSILEPGQPVDPRFESILNYIDNNRNKVAVDKSGRYVDAFNKPYHTVVKNAIIAYARDNFTDYIKLGQDMRADNIPSRIVELSPGRSGIYLNNLLDPSKKIPKLSESTSASSFDELIETWDWLQTYSQPSPASSSGFTGRIERVGEAEGESGSQAQEVVAKPKTGEGMRYRRPKIVDNYMVRDLPKQFTFTPLRIFHDDVF